jgi:hypothetical protein
MGTPDYMAPEQARGAADLDARCDLFSLGCVLYHMATGRKPFHGDDVMATLLALATEEPMPMRQINPDIPWELEERVKALMMKKAGDRPRDARMVVEELAYLERNLATLSLRPRPKAGSGDYARPVLPGGISRSGAPNRQRRTVNPNASVDELLRSPSPSADKAITDSKRGKGPAAAPSPTSSSDTAPLEKMGLSDWSGPAAPLAPPEKPNNVRPKSSDTAPLSRPLDLPKKPPPAAPVTTSAPPTDLRGSCPKCGSKRFGKMGLGWCQACGYSADSPNAAVDAVADVQARYRAEQSLTWVWAVLIGAAVIAGATYYLSTYFRRGTPGWTLWVWYQFSAGAGSFLFAYVWAYILVWQFHDDSQTFLPMFCTPLRFLRVVYKRSYQTKNAVCLGCWGLTATVAIFVVVGDAKFWWKGDERYRAKIPQPVFAMPPSEDKDPEAPYPADCKVIGYVQEGSQLTKIILSESGKYAGMTSVWREDAATADELEHAAAVLARNARSSPPINGVPSNIAGARWVESVLGCTVRHAGKDAQGRLINPRVVAWQY